MAPHDSDCFSWPLTKTLFLTFDSSLIGPVLFIYFYILQVIPKASLDPAYLILVLVYDNTTAAFVVVFKSTTVGLSPLSFTMLWGVIIVGACVSPSCDWTVGCWPDAQLLAWLLVTRCVWRNGRWAWRGGVCVGCPLPVRVVPISLFPSPSQNRIRCSTVEPASSYARHGCWTGYPRFMVDGDYIFMPFGATHALSALCL